MNFFNTTSDDNGGSGGDQGSGNEPVRLARNFDDEYQKLLREILEHGVDSDNRTGVGTKAIFGAQLTVDAVEGFPALGLRKVSPRIAFEELMFMLNGKSQTKELEEKGITIWQGNTTKEFQKKVGLSHLDEGDFGRMYGIQLREFNGVDEYKRPTQFDQLKYMIKEIQTNPTSRRIIASQFNPAEASQGVLFPCHMFMQFNVRGEELDMLFWLRSSDVGFGLPYNMMYYAMFLTLVANMTGKIPGRLTYQAGDCHIYKDQIKSGMIDYMLEEGALEKARKSVPKFKYPRQIISLDHLLALEWPEMELKDYHPRPDFDNKPGMAV